MACENSQPGILKSRRKGYGGQLKRWSESAVSKVGTGASSTQKKSSNLFNPSTAIACAAKFPSLAINSNLHEEKFLVRAFASQYYVQATTSTGYQ
ncbi:hypothetical protein V6Z12_D13G104400 [Gossypium hirsutum]